MRKPIVRRGVVIRAIWAPADGAHGGGETRGDADIVVGIHVGAHGHALVRASKLLELTDGDAGGGQGVKAGAQVAGVALREAALDLQERGEHDDHQHHRGHHGKRQNEGET